MHIDLDCCTCSIALASQDLSHWCTSCTLSFGRAQFLSIMKIGLTLLVCNIYTTLAAYSTVLLNHASGLIYLCS